MKKYKFDYIREMVSEWHPSVKVDLNGVLGTPYKITLPMIMPETNEDGNFQMVYYPARDYYGEEIENTQDWLKQREKYCKNLVKEIKKEKRKEIWKKLKFL